MFFGFSFYFFFDADYNTYLYVNVAESIEYADNITKT